MLKILHRIPGALLLLLPTLALAQNGIYTSLESGWAGKSGLPSQSAVGASQVHRDDAPVARLAIGYVHDFFPKFGAGLEAGRGWYGHYTYRFSTTPSGSIRSSTTEFLAVAVLHQAAWDYLVKTGGIRNTSKIRYYQGNRDSTRIQPEVALGLAYTFRPHFAVMGEYAHSFGSSIHSLAKPNWASPSLNELLLGLRVTFY